MERERESERMGKRGNERAREAGMVHADTREITAFAYVWIHRSSERASASGRPGFAAGTARDGGGENAKREERKRERQWKRKGEREGQRERGERRRDAAGDATKGEKDRGLSPVRVRREDGGESAE